MTELIAITFATSGEAQRLKDKLPELTARLQIDADDAVVITRDASGSVELHQNVNLRAAQAIGGSVWGLVLGAIFMVPIMGAMVGAGAGLITGALSDVGIDDRFAREFGSNLPENGSALCLLIRRDNADALVAALEAEAAYGQILRSAVNGPGILRRAGPKAGRDVTNRYPEQPAI